MKKILVVDPLSSSLEKKTSALSRPGFHINGVVTAEEALEILRNDPTDVLISELDMPGMKGDELCSEIRKTDGLKNLSVILIGFESQSAMDRSESCGANAYLSKPLSPKELYGKVNELLNVHGRENFRVLMKVTVKGKVKAESFFCTSHNLSVSGVLLETTKLLSHGDNIECAFFLRSNSITVHGEVAREEKKPPDIYLYGVKFIDLPPESHDLINDFVNSRNPAR